MHLVRARLGGHGNLCQHSCGYRYPVVGPGNATGEVDFLDTTAPCNLHDDEYDRFTLTKFG
jgi:hypothetical protein